MDLHSYAKGAKKWCIEHTRKLVNSRITYDNMFSNHPVMSLVPWKKFVHLTKLDDFHPLFVRNHWFNLVETYKHQKELRLDNLSTKSSSLVHQDILLGHNNSVADEWEFFPSLHRFMTRKTTNLHSYALKEPNNQGESATSRRTHRSLRQQQQQQYNITNMPNELSVITHIDEIEEQQEQINTILSSITPSASPVPNINVTLCSNSDANDEFAAAMGLLNDHDFYSKKSNISIFDDQQQSPGNWQFSNCFGDGSDDTKETLNQLIGSSKLVLLDDDCSADIQLPNFIREEITETTQANNAVYSFSAAVAEAAAAAVIAPDINQIDQPKIKPKTDRKKRATPQPRKSRRIQNIKTNEKNLKQQLKQQQEQQQKQQSFNDAALGFEPHKAIEERLAYYRHKRRYNHRQEKRFDALLAVLGQIVQFEYPNVDMTPLSSIIDTSSDISSDAEIE